ncbi:MAG: hypothetical protein R3B06_14885 [Kofleriaceae bacterium]
MRNYWVQTESEQVEWSVDLLASLDPTTLVDLLCEIARLASIHEVASMDVAAIRIELTEALREHQRVDCSLTRRRTPSAKCAWFTREGKLTEGDTTNLGALLRTLEPTPGAISARYSSSWSPLSILGSTVRFANGPTKDVSSCVSFGFTTCSDIWFPFVLGIAHPSCDGKRYFDNRELAARHTPRLNQFLAQVAELTAAAGATWSVTDGMVSPQLQPWVTERGIRLDGPVPPLMPSELVDVPWPSLDE